MRCGKYSPQSTASPTTGTAPTSPGSSYRPDPPCRPPYRLPQQPSPTLKPIGYEGTSCLAAWSMSTVALLDRPALLQLTAPNRIFERDNLAEWTEGRSLRFALPGACRVGSLPVLSVLWSQIVNL